MNPTLEFREKDGGVGETTAGGEGLEAGGGLREPRQASQRQRFQKKWAIGGLARLFSPYAKAIIRLSTARRGTS